VVNIFFGKPTTIGESNTKWQVPSAYFPEYERIKRMTAIDFISSVGGLFGLCLGFRSVALHRLLCTDLQPISSLISFFEILYWFIIRLGRNLTGWVGCLATLPRPDKRRRGPQAVGAVGPEATGTTPPPATYIIEPVEETGEDHGDWVSNRHS
jgi:hypothetical protein